MPTAPSLARAPCCPDAQGGTLCRHPTEVARRALRAGAGWPGVQTLEHLPGGAICRGGRRLDVINYFSKSRVISFSAHCLCSKIRIQDAPRRAVAWSRAGGPQPGPGPQTAPRRRATLGSGSPRQRRLIHGPLALPSRCSRGKGARKEHGFRCRCRCENEELTDWVPSSTNQRMI